MHKNFTPMSSNHETCLSAIYKLMNITDAVRFADASASNATAS